jgi:hypothetical protein
VRDHWQTNSGTGKFVLGVSILKSGPFLILLTFLLFDHLEESTINSFLALSVLAWVAESRELFSVYCACIGFQGTVAFATYTNQHQSGK